MSVYELTIDGSGAERGAQKIVKSFSDILAASKRMESGVVDAANKMVSAFSRLSNVRTVSREAISQLNALSSSLSKFRGPSKAAIDNTSRFLSFLNSVGRINVPSGARLGAFLATISGYRGPTATAGRNTQSVLRALSGFSPPAGVNSRLTSFLSSLASYRGPSANAGKNTTALLNALSSYRGSPPNLRAAVTQFRALADAIERASRAMGTLRRASAPALRTPIIGGGGRGGFNPRHYANDMNLLHNALVRTNTAFNALGGILAARSIITASNSIIQIRAQLEAATGSAQQARVQFAFLRQTAEELGLEFTGLARSYGFFLGSIRGTNVTMAQAREIFHGFSVAARALQLSTADVDGVFRALGQIMSKGKLQAEELRQQLGDRLPGAFVMFARALDLTRPGELDDALKRGAISGDRLRDAILRVSRELETTFSPTAEKMSRTVDAAFNRLRNSFTFAAEGLGRSGLNEGLINIIDSLRRILESEGLATLLGIIGNAFKFVGENANLFLSVLTGGLIAYTLRSVVAFGALRAVLTQIMALRAAAAVQGIAAACMALSGSATAATVATSRLGVAMRALFVVARAHPFVLLGTAIAAVLVYLTSLENKQAEARRALQNFNDTTADAQNYLDAYIARVYDSTNALDTETASLRENTIALIQNARARASELSLGQVRSGRQLPAWMGGGWVTGMGGSQQYVIGGQVIDDPNLAMALNRLTGSRPGRTPFRTELGVNVPTNAAEFERMARGLGELEGYIRAGGRQAEQATAIRDAASGIVNSIVREGNIRGNTLGYNPQEILTRIVGTDYNREQGPEGLSGEAMERPDRSGAAAARAYEQDIRRALESLRDLRRETAVARNEMNAYLGVVTQTGEVIYDAVEAQARGAAEARVNNFMDSFRDVGTANRGLVELNQLVHNQADILEQLSPAARQAREELIAFFATEERAAMEARRGAEVAQDIDRLRRENALRQQSVEATRQGGAALADANREIEIQTQLYGVAAEDEQRLRRGLEEQLRLQERINRELQVAEEFRRAGIEAAVNEQVAGLYSQGALPEQIEAYRELVELRERLVDEGYDNAQVNALVRLRHAALQQQQVMRELQESYDRVRQLAQDQADAIVDSFREGIEEGRSFLSVMKDIFNQLKRIILDFVLYNPLRRFLTDIFTQYNSGQVDPGNTKLSSVANLTNSLMPGVLPTILQGGGVMQAQGAPSMSESKRATGIAKSIGQTAGEVIAEESGDIIVVGQRRSTEALEEIQKIQTSPRYFENLRRIFSGTGFQDIKNVFTGGIKQLGKTLPKALGAAGNAFAAYTLGKGLARGLGLGRVGGEIAGGAAAGFSLGGPIGGAIGAVLGLGKALLFKKKIPSAFGTVTVSDSGVAIGGQGQKYGKADASVGTAAAKAGATLFNQFAIEFDANLKAGNYGSFGRRKFKMPGEDQELAFYSTQGVSRKGKPLGREGVDWIKGTESEVQAFALLSQIRGGKITGLSPTMATVAQNTTAKTMEDLQADFAIGQAYDEFIKGSFKLPEVRKQIFELNQSFEKLRKQSASLGLAESKLVAARDRLLKTMREEFNWDVQQGILEYENPGQAAYNQLVREYKDAVDNAMAVGGDLAAVEKLFGLKRKELMERTFNEALDTMRTTARELLTELTATTSSPLASSTTFRNARERFFGLRGELMVGNLTNAGNLGQYASNYLDTAREMYGSSAQYFDIFRDVTEFLASMQEYTGGGGVTGGDDIPDLPALQALIDEIKARDAELLAATNATGMAVVEGDSAQIAELQKMGLTLEQIAALLGGAGGAVTPPASGGSGGRSLRTIANTPKLL